MSWSAASGDDDRVAEGGAAGALWCECAEHDDELALDEIEHVGYGIDPQHEAAEREVRHSAERDLELTLRIRRDGEHETGRIDVDVERLVGREALTDHGRGSVGRDGLRRGDQPRYEVAVAEHGD